MNIKEEAAKMKLASPLMASASAEKRNSALLHMIENLEAGKEKIFAANGIDLAAAKASGLAPALMKRLAFDEGKLADSISSDDLGYFLRIPWEKSLLPASLMKGSAFTASPVPSASLP